MPISRLTTVVDTQISRTITVAGQQKVHIPSEVDLQRVRLILEEEQVLGITLSVADLQNQLLTLVEAQ
jgi:hypothetical protein